MSDWNPVIPGIQPSLGSSFGRALELARGVAADELELLRIDARDEVKGTLRRGALLTFGLVCLLLAWLAALGAAVVALEPRLPLEARLGLVAAFQALIGAIALALGLHPRAPKHGP